MRDGVSTTRRDALQLEAQLDRPLIERQATKHFLEDAAMTEMSIPDAQTAMAYAARAGARPGDRISRLEALHISPVA